MELNCRHCGARFRVAVQLPLPTAVRVACPACKTQVVIKPAAPPAPPLSVRPQRRSSDIHAVPRPSLPSYPPGRRVAAIADEPRPFRAFLGEQLRRLGFDVTFFDTGDPVLDFVRRVRADLAIVNVYLKGKLGVEVTEDIRADGELEATRVILIGALFRANRFRANPTNLYGADEYIEEQIPEKEFRHVVQKLFPEIGSSPGLPLDAPEMDEARRLARLILSDIVIYNTTKVDDGIRNDSFFDVLATEIEEGRRYYESRIAKRFRDSTDVYAQTLEQFVEMKREELVRAAEQAPPAHEGTAPGN